MSAAQSASRASVGLATEEKRNAAGELLIEHS